MPKTPQSLRPSMMIGRRDDEPVGNENSEDSNYLPISKDDINPGNEEFIMPEESLEQEHFKRQLIATVQSLKKKQR